MGSSQGETVLYKTCCFSFYFYLFICILFDFLVIVNGHHLCKLQAFWDSCRFSRFFEDLSKAEGLFDCTLLYKYMGCRLPSLSRP